MKRIGCTALCAIFLLWLCACAPMPSQEPSTPQAPTPSTTETAFVRAFWIPYMQVETLLSSGEPQACRAALAACFADVAATGANTVYFHVRANSDAYYDAAVFPPHPTTAALLAQGFDPLACAVEEAHAVGLKLHAWINPYRIGTDVSRARAQAVFSHGERWYYAPHDAAAQALIVDGVREIVQKYAVDGVQFDDYFYPSGAVDTQTPAAFEKDAFAAYTQSGGRLTVGDWRRAHVSALMAACLNACHGREGCAFGVSPSYDIRRCREEMYADVALWARTAGYVDYLCPQLYVGFEHEYAPFGGAVEMWQALPRDDTVALYAGLALYKTGLAEDAYAGSGRAEWASAQDILARQIALVRSYGWDGAALYSHQSLDNTDGRAADTVSREADAAFAQWR